MVKADRPGLSLAPAVVEDGQYGSVVELANAEKINKSYVSRVLRLSLLAPPIIEAILNGADAAGAAAGGVGSSAQTPDGCTAVHCGEVICRTHRTLSWRLARSRAKRNHFQNPKLSAGFSFLDIPDYQD
jgi:hypothetical protein